MIMTVRVMCHDGISSLPPSLFSRCGRWIHPNHFGLIYICHFDWAPFNRVLYVLYICDIICDIIQYFFDYVYIYICIGLFLL